MTVIFHCCLYCTFEIEFSDGRGEKEWKFLVIDSTTSFYHNILSVSVKVVIAWSSAIITIPSGKACAGEWKFLKSRKQKQFIRSRNTLPVSTKKEETPNIERNKINGDKSKGAKSENEKKKERFNKFLGRRYYRRTIILLLKNGVNHCWSMLFRRQLWMSKLLNSYMKKSRRRTKRTTHKKQ